MVKVKNEFHPDYAVPPGEILEYELELRAMSQKELSDRTGITSKHLISIIKGDSAITPQTAIKLERVLGMPVDYWLNLESQYREILARKSEQKQLERDLEWLKRVPVNEMAKRGWIEKPKDKMEVLDRVLKFFGIASVAQWDDIWPNLAVAYRQHQKHEVFPEAVSAWLRKGELESHKIQCSKFDKSGFKALLSDLRELTTKTPENFVPELQQRCANFGVAVVFVPALPKTSVSGATRWLTKDKALIQLSLRYKSNDHLWFTFFHEAGHILLHGKKEMFLEGTNGLDGKKEEEADKFAEEMLIPRAEFNAFVKTRNFYADDIRGFADAIGIAPGIVVGQLQHKKFLPQNFCNELKQRYKWEG